MKAGTVIEAGVHGARATGVIAVVLGGEGKGTKKGTDLYKCIFSSAVRVRNVGSITETQPITKAKKVHILFKGQFEVLDY